MFAVDQRFEVPRWISRESGRTSRLVPTCAPLEPRPAAPSLVSMYCAVARKGEPESRASRTRYKSGMGARHRRLPFANVDSMLADCKTLRESVDATVEPARLLPGLDATWLVQEEYAECSAALLILFAFLHGQHQSAAQTLASRSRAHFSPLCEPPQ